MKAFVYPLLIALLLSAGAVTAQDTTTPATATPPQLAKEFQSLKQRSNSYKEGERQFKVVNVKTLDAFWQSVEKAIAATKQGLQNDRATAEQELTKARTTIAQLQQQVQALKQENAGKEAQLQQNLHAVNNLSVLGVDMSKQLYVPLSLGLILVLLVALAMTLLQHKASKKVAVDKQRAYEGMEQELNEYKKSARERELKIKRELQTEMNRIEELNQEIARLQKQLQS